MSRIKKKLEMKHCQKVFQKGGAEQYELFLCFWVTLNTYTRAHTYRKTGKHTKCTKKQTERMEKELSKTLSIHFVQMNWFYGIFNKLFAMSFDFWLHKKKTPHMQWIQKRGRSANAQSKSKP